MPADTPAIFFYTLMKKYYILPPSYVMSELKAGDRFLLDIVKPYAGAVVTWKWAEGFREFLKKSVREWHERNRRANIPEVTLYLGPFGATPCLCAGRVCLHFSPVSWEFISFLPLVPAGATIAPPSE